MVIVYVKKTGVKAIKHGQVGFRSPEPARQSNAIRCLQTGKNAPDDPGQPLHLFLTSLTAEAAARALSGARSTHQTLTDHIIAMPRARCEVLAPALRPGLCEQITRKEIL